MTAKKTQKKRSVKNRIAMVSTHGYVAAEPPLGVPDTGGQVVYVLELSKKLALLGYKVDIWTRQFEDHPQTESVDENVRIIRVPCGGKDFIPKEYLYKKLPEWTEHALRFIKKHKLQYQFINSHYWDAGVAAQSLADALNVIHVHTPHSLGSWKKEQMETDFPEDKHTFEEKYNFNQRIHHERMLYRECDLITATSPPQLDLIKQDYDISPEKIRLIPPGYDDTRFFPIGESSRQIIRDQLGYKGKKVIASIGRLARNKGFDLLIKAFHIVLAREPNAHLRLAVGTETGSAGDEPLLQELQDLITGYNFQEHVTLTGSLPDAEMADFYRAADVFALPSRYEPIGMTAIEAMACGTPSVLTTHGGLHRTLEYGIDALYADPLDQEDFGITLLKILRYASLRERLAIQGARKMRSLFTWIGIAQQLLRAVEGRI